MKRPIPERTGAYGSRKFVLTLVGLALMVVIAMASVFSPAIPAVMPTFTGGILGVLSLYFAGNVTNKLVVGKVMNDAKATDPDEAGGD